MIEGMASNFIFTASNKCFFIFVMWQGDQSLPKPNLNGGDALSNMRHGRAVKSKKSNGVSEKSPSASKLSDVPNQNPGVSNFLIS